MKIRQTISALAIALAALGANGAYAAPITYDVNQIIGPGSITGTITTDGTIGTLSAANITGFNLILNDGTKTATLSSPGLVFVNANTSSSAGTPNGADLTATSTNLFFNYSGSDAGDFVLEGDPTFNGEICYTSTSNCWGPTGVGLYNVGLDGQSVFISQTGNQIIASVPEPSTWAMLLLGLFGVGFMMRSVRRKEAVAVV